MGQDETSTIDSTVRQLRQISRETDEGKLIGSEDELTRLLQVSVSSIRQAARLVEREGFLRVKRGRYGGYFSARPGARTIEAALAQIDVGPVKPEETNILSTAMWKAAVARAAALPPGETAAVVRKLVAKVKGIKGSASFGEVRAVDSLTRAEIFKLSAFHYFDLVSRMTTIFSARALLKDIDDFDPRRHVEFVQGWRDYTLLQLEGIGKNDAALAEFAASRVCEIIYARVR
jgi:GntR family transcriptional repressor for pyruvate dehydrogenase complex